MSRSSAIGLGHMHPPRRADDRLDDDSVVRARAGDEQARTAIFKQWLPVVLAWCTRLGGPRVDPEDAAHDVFLVVMRRLDDVQQPAKFPQWLFGITRRILRQHRRRAWVNRWLRDHEVDDLPDERSGAEDRAASNELSRRVWRILDDLPAPQREVLVLASIEGRSLREVSELLGIPQGTVGSRVRLARAKFERMARARGLDCLIAPGVDI